MPLKSLRCCLFLLVSFVAIGCSESPDEKSASTSPAASTETIPLWGDAPHTRPKYVKGIHLTAWATGNKQFRDKFEPLLAETELNTAVIDIKESHGEVYITGIELDGKKVYTSAVKDMKEYVKFLKDRGIYTIARMTVFHDNHLAKIKPEWAIRSSQPLAKAKEKGYREDVWVDKKGSAWADPYNRHVWDYNLQIALRAVELGFQEIQYDYIRFPSDGPTKLCVYSKPHSRANAVKALQEFLQKSREKLNAKGVPLSIDVFGLVGSTADDMGIGQKLADLVGHVDVVSPMMYPSHYYPGEYGLKEPNSQPYETINRSIKDTQNMMKTSTTNLRPWLQDFSLGVKYNARMVRAQIVAAEDLDVHEWLLWNPQCRYTKDALMPFYKPVEGQPLRPVKPEPKAVIPDKSSEAGRDPESIKEKKSEKKEKN